MPVPEKSKYSTALKIEFLTETSILLRIFRYHQGIHEHGLMGKGGLPLSTERRESWAAELTEQFDMMYAPLYAVKTREVSQEKKLFWFFSRMNENKNELVVLGCKLLF